MTFSSEWEQRYKEKTHMSVWPWSDLVSYVMRYVQPTNNQIKVLEIGCGAGANIPFFLAQRFKYYGIDGSQTIVNKLKRRFPRIKGNLISGDFTRQIPFDEEFDLVVDRSSLTHDTTEGIKHCLDLVHEKMKDNAKYIGIDWFSTDHQDFSVNVKKIDRYTRTGYTTGQFANIGLVHFSNKSHLLKLFEKFEIMVLEHKVVVSEVPRKKKFATWNFVAKK
jgi:SAM-dependent methyltransferase